ncbi:DUF2939 domain-containing protein [Halomonas sp. I5-271120]|uniref:DUF2939 domain-containing protein n=1 Tax=Halomonas sp. I5-271120 TaxID=3061632 RepID=UPI002714F0A7|nr:DUF2939 domain-containing protein [Halomonas sp. I5-271120]
MTLLAGGDTLSPATSPPDMDVMYMKKTLAVIGLTSVVAIAGSPYLTSYQMKSAADARDGEALAKHVNFPELRQNLKDQINLMIAERAEQEVGTNHGAIAMLGAAVGSLLTDKLVESYVTPTALAAKLDGRPEGASSAGEPSREQGTGKPGEEEEDGLLPDSPFGDASLGYDAWDEFHIVVHNDDGEPLTFVLHRHMGVFWELTNIVIPSAALRG